MEPLFATVVLCTEDDAEAATLRVPLQSDTTIRQLAKESMRRLVLSRRKHDAAWANVRLCVTAVTVTGEAQPSAEVFSEDIVATVVCARTEVVRMRLRVDPSTTPTASSQPVETSDVCTPSIEPAAEAGTPVTVAAHKGHPSAAAMVDEHDEALIKPCNCGTYKRVRQPPLPSTPPTVPAYRRGRRLDSGHVRTAKGVRETKVAAAASSASASTAKTPCMVEASSASSSEASVTARHLLYEESEVGAEGGGSVHGQLRDGVSHDHATQSGAAMSQILTPSKTADASAHKSTPRLPGWGSEATRFFDLHTYCDDPRKAKLTPEELRQPVRAHRNVVLPPYFALLDVI